MAKEITKTDSTSKRKKATEKGEVKEKVTKTTKKTTSNKKTQEKEKIKSNTDKNVKSKTTSSKSKASKSAVSTPKKKSVAKQTTRTRKTNSTAKTMLTEYYDLPYGYNKTMVKVLAQTPTTLFVYWDISKEDRASLETLHGNDFFTKTKPILIVHNVTKNYSFEIEINDFANSWYIRTQEPNCDYIIELGRKLFNSSEEYVFISSSNDMISPNDHILFENTNLGNVLFKNVKTNTISSKDFGNLSFINKIDKLYGNVYDVYNKLYDNETLNEISMPNSGEFIRK